MLVANDNASHTLADAETAMTMTANKKSQAALRARRARLRHKHGIRILSVAVDFIALTEKLSDAGFLDWSQIDDPRAAAEAVAAYLHQSDEHE